MSVFVSICKGCGRKVGVPKPGSIPDIRDIAADCPFCGTKVYAKDGFDVAEPPEQKEPFDLLKVN